MRIRFLVMADDPASGHQSAARAVHEALQSLPDVESRMVDLYEQSPGIRQRLWGEMLPRLRGIKPVTRYIFKKDLKPSRTLRAIRKLMTRINRWSLSRFENSLPAQKPHAILSAHQLINALTGIWRQKEILNAPVYCVVTDYVAHGVWPQEHIERYYVASEDVKEDLLRQGVARERIRVTGIPVTPRMTAPDSRSPLELREALGLRPDLPLILLMGGGRGYQKYLPILQALDRTGIRAQVAVFCGRSHELRKNVEERASRLRLPIKVLGFQSNMPEWYRAADVVITKPGGLSTTEVLVNRKPMILVSPIAGMEEAQVERLVRAGAALYGSSPEQAAELVKAVLGNSALQERLAEAQSRLARPDAAFVIARDLVRSVKPG